MSKIIEIANQDGKLLVGSRLVAEHFEKEHKNILRTIDGLVVEIQPAQNCARCFIESNYVDAKGETRKEYLLTRDGFSLVVMGFTGQKALEWKLKYIDAFNKMEEALKNQNAKMLPTTYKEALMQLLEQVEKNEKLLEKNRVLTPKAEYHDEVLNKNGLLTTTFIAKDLGLRSANVLNKELCRQKILFKNTEGSYTPYADYDWLIKDGYADYQSYTSSDAKPYLKWTEKGRKYIVENYGKWAMAIVSA